MRRKALALLPLLCAVFLLAGGGCGQGEGDGLSTEQVSKAEKSDEIIKKANGSWDSLSAEDKAYLVDKIGYGNEHNARMFFDAKSGNLRRSGGSGGPGTPPVPGQAPRSAN